MNAAVFASDESSHEEFFFLFHLVASDQITQSLCA